MGKSKEPHFVLEVVLNGSISMRTMASLGHCNAQCPKFLNQERKLSP